MIELMRFSWSVTVFFAWLSFEKLVKDETCSLNVFLSFPRYVCENSTTPNRFIRNVADIDATPLHVFLNPAPVASLTWQALSCTWTTTTENA